MRSAALIGLLALAGCGDKAEERPPVAARVSAAATPTETIASPAPTGSDGPSESAIGFSEKHFQALGTEPFWSIEVLSGKLLYTSPDKQTGVAIVSRLTSEGKRLRYSGAMDGKAVSLVIERGDCSDGMSDTVYAYKASFAWGERTEYGCAKLK